MPPASRLGKPLDVGSTPQTPGEPNNIQRCSRYVERYVLKEVKSPVVFALDEVDSIIESPFRSDFFAMLRTWHNNRASREIWQQMDLVLATSTEPYQLVQNLNQSPFNVGEVIELADFTSEQIAKLNELHDMPFSSVSSP